MVSRGIFHTVPTKPNLFGISGKNKVKQQEQSDEPELSEKQIMMFEKETIDNGIELIRNIFKNNNKENMLKPGWEEKVETFIRDLYLEEKNKLITLQGGVGSDALTVPKPKFSATNYLNILVSIVFFVAAIFFLASFYSTVKSIVEFNIPDIIQGLQISDRTKIILCDAFNTGKNDDDINAMARIWYSLSCFFAGSRPKSVTDFEIKIWNVIQNVLTNAIIESSKDAKTVCVGNAEGFIGIANQFSALFSNAPACMVDTASISSEQMLKESQYIMTVLKTSLLQKGYNAYYNPTYAIVTIKIGMYYFNRFKDSVIQFRVKDAEYNNSIQGNPTAEPKNVIFMKYGTLGDYMKKAPTLYIPPLIKDLVSNTSNNASNRPSAGPPRASSRGRPRGPIEVTPSGFKVRNNVDRSHIIPRIENN